MAGRLIMVPVPLGADPPASVLPPATLDTVRALDLFFVESAKSARAFLKAAGVPGPIQSLEIHEFDADTPETALDGLVGRVAAGRDAGVLSEAGAPGVADPGARLARRAHHAGVTVVPCVGPSAILLALMAGGLEGQRFAFHGYLPIETPALQKALQQIEARSGRERATQIFIETPYRNDRLIDTMLMCLQSETTLSIACDLSGATELVATMAVGAWRDRPPAIGKRPAVFSLLAAPSGPRARGRRGNG